MGNTPHAHLRAKGSKPNLLKLHKYLEDTKLYQKLSLDDPSYQHLNSEDEAFYTIDECYGKDRAGMLFQLDYYLDLHKANEEAFKQISADNHNVEIEFEYYFFLKCEHHYKTWVNGKLIKEINQDEPDYESDNEFQALCFPKAEIEINEAYDLIWGALAKIGMDLRSLINAPSSRKCSDKRLSSLLSKIKKESDKFSKATFMGIRDNPEINFSFDFSELNDLYEEYRRPIDEEHEQMINKLMKESNEKEARKSAS